MAADFEDFIDLNRAGKSELANFSSRFRFSLQSWDRVARLKAARAEVRAALAAVTAGGGEVEAGDEGEVEEEEEEEGEAGGEEEREEEEGEGVTAARCW